MPSSLLRLFALLSSWLLSFPPGPFMERASAGSGYLRVTIAIYAGAASRWGSGCDEPLVFADEWRFGGPER